MMQYFRRAMAIILSFMLVTGVLGVGVLAEDSSPDPSPQIVPYVNAKGVAKVAVNCLPVAANMSDGWYAVTEDTQIDGWIEISGAVNLILCDGKTLKANEGIHVPEGASLTIWAQSVYTEGSTTGKLVSVGSNGLAGIGPANGQKGGTVVINGGNIDSGCNSTNSINAPGIGGSVIAINGGKVNARSKYGAAIGSARSGECGNITITGGEVSGESDEGAGIGLGTEGSISGNVTINGGTVTAKSHYRSAGIGGSYESHLNSITITGGTVTAISSVDGRNDYNYHGAGIGGGAKGESGTITISGGSVTATSNGRGAGIGSGYKADSNDITITGNATVTATSTATYIGGAGIGGGEEGNAKGTITISGNAKVTAKTDGSSAGIGGGWSGERNGNLTGSVIIKDNASVTAVGNYYGAGIGGGHGGNARDGHIHISGNAHVYAYAGLYAAGIGGGEELGAYGGEGCGDVRIEGSAVVFAQTGPEACSAIGHGRNDSYMGSITFGRGLCVKAGNVLDGIDGTYEPLFSAGLRAEACKWRFKALIQPCDHPGEIHYVHISEYGHLRDTCPYCDKLFIEEPHEFDDYGKCKSCGYMYGDLVKISFDANGGDGEMESRFFMPTAFYTLPECGFDPPTGKTFHGWLITATGTTEEDPVSGIHFPYETILLPGGGIVELKANWEGDTTMTISRGEGTGEDKTVYLSQGEKYPLPTPESLGFTGPQWFSFAGWRINNDAENLKQPLETITIEGDTAITAIWTRVTRTVTFDTNEGGTVAAQTLLNGETVTKPENPTRNDDTFQDWYLGDEVFDFTTPVTRDLTLTARWLGAWGELQQQIDQAASGDTVALTENVTADSYDVPILIDGEKSITLDLNGYTIDRALTEARGNGNVITVKGGLTLTDSSSKKTGKITGGHNLERGGGVIISNNGTLTLNGGIISGNNTESDGGGVYIDEGTFVMNGGAINGNNAEEGGGVQVNDSRNGYFYMNGGTISDNQAYYGGGVGIDGGTFTMEGGSITGNSTKMETTEYKYYGGGVYVIYGTFTMKGGSISNNTAMHGGGGVYSEDEFTMTGGTINKNTAKSGGGVYSEYDFTMTGGSITGNEAHGGGYHNGGGGVYITNEAVFTLEGGEISGNSTASDGGGVYITDSGELVMTNNSSITGNTAETDGGGVYLYDYCRFTMESGTISGNTTGECGSGVSVYYGSEFTLNGGEISGNKGCTYGGGVDVDSGNITLRGGVIRNNEADYQGGGVNIGGDATLTITNTSITGNHIINSDKEDDAFGGGVYVDKYNSSVTFKLSGSPVISGNTNDKGVSNVYLTNGNVFTIDSQLTSGASVGVDMDTPGNFTTGYKTYNEGSEPSTYFSGDSNSYIVGLDDNGEAKLVFAAEAFGTPDFTLPADITLIEEYAFEGIDAHIVYIPDGCTEIGTYAFKDCANLRQIRIPEGCAIGEFAFYGCEHVYVFSVPGGGAEQYCRYHDNCTFVEEDR